MCMQLDRCALWFGLQEGKVACVSHKKFWHLLMDQCSEMVEKLPPQMLNLCVVLRVRLITRAAIRKELFSRSGHERLEIVFL